MNRTAYRNYLHTEIQRQLPDYLIDLQKSQDDFTLSFKYSPNMSVEDLLETEELEIYLSEDLKHLLVVAGDWAALGGIYYQTEQWDYSKCGIFENIVQSGLSKLGIPIDIDNLSYELEAEITPNIILPNGTRQKGHCDSLPLYYHLIYP